MAGNDPEIHSAQLADLEKQMRRGRTMKSLPYRFGNM